MTCLKFRDTHINIPANHGYTLLGTNTVYNADGSVKANLFKIRNPWGSDAMYNGSWSDDDNVWNTVGQNYKQQVGFEKKDDGVFFMTY